MRQILVAVFDTVANADRAVQALEDANVPSASIRRYHRDDPACGNFSPERLLMSVRHRLRRLMQTEPINAPAASGRG